MGSRKEGLLARGLELALAGRPLEAVETLATLQGLLNLEAVPEDWSYFLFATAICRRLEGAEAGVGNPYLHLPRDAGARQIDLFRLLTEHMPLASAATSVADRVLLEWLRGRPEATLLDIGIGQGRQTRGLLKLLAREGALPQRLSVVGVDPSGASLREAETTVRDTAREVGADVGFVGLSSRVEVLGNGVWKALRQVPRPLVVNAAFALHHVTEAPFSGGVTRDEVLRRLRSLEPAGVVLCEPNVDHHRAPVRERFFNAWNHFSRIFALLDTLDVPPQERVAIKRFFGREVDDIVGTLDETKRCERHETAPSWWERLERAGFERFGDLERARSSGVHPAVELRVEPGCVGVHHAEEMLVAVLCAVPAAREAG